MTGPAELYPSKLLFTVCVIAIAIVRCCFSSLSLIATHHSKRRIKGILPAVLPAWSEQHLLYCRLHQRGIHAMLDSPPAASHYPDYNTQYIIHVVYVHTGVGMQWLQLGHIFSSMED